MYFSGKDWDAPCASQEAQGASGETYSREGQAIRLRRPPACTGSLSAGEHIRCFAVTSSSAKVTYRCVVVRVVWPKTV